MTFDNRKGVYAFFDRLPVCAFSGRGTGLLFVVLVATGLAFVLSLPGASAWAWHQSPTAFVSPVPTQTDQPPTPAPAAPVMTSAPTLGTPVPSPSGERSLQGSERGMALLVAGGIVLAGLIAGVVVFLLEGVMSS